MRTMIPNAQLVGSTFNRKPSYLLTSTALMAVGGLLISSPAMADSQHSWDNLSQQAGSFTTDTSVEDVTNIKLNTSRAVGVGNADIYADDTVNIDGAFFAVRDNREDPTRILGRLNSNGEVMVLDRNGVFFGKNSFVDVAGIITSTGDISDADLMDGNGTFEFTNFGDGKIELNGTINVAEAGLSAFVSPTITNNGLINAKMGRVAMAAGDTVTLDLYGDSLVEIAIDNKLEDALIEQAGTINAQGGQVIITAQAAKEAVDNIINMSGVINASSASVEGGKIVLGGGDQGTVKVSGKMDVSGADKGGEIDIKGQNIDVTEDAELIADGGNGDITMIADERLAYHGAASAMDGFIETSAPEVIIDGTFKVGSNGEVLIDPMDLCVFGSGGSCGTMTSTIDFVTSIQPVLIGGGTVTTTNMPGLDDGDIAIVGDLSYTATNRGTWNVVANDDFYFGSDGSNVAAPAQTATLIVDGAGLNVNFATAGGAGALSPFVMRILENSTLSTGGGDATFIADNFYMHSGASIDAGTGTVSFGRTTDGAIYVGDSSFMGLSITQDILDSISANTVSIGFSTNAADNNIVVGNVDMSAFAQTQFSTKESNLGLNESVSFVGDNTFQALEVSADDTVFIENDASVSASGDVLITGQANTIPFGGFIMQENATLSSDANIRINTYDAILGANALIESAGGNIVIDNSNIFTSTDTDTVATNGTGTISINQNDGGSIQMAVDAVNNSGTGRNTIHVGAGTYNESVRINDDNVTLLGANESIVGYGVRGTESVINAVTDGVYIAGDNAEVNGFKIVGGDRGVFVNGDDANVSFNYIDASASNGIGVYYSKNAVMRGNYITNSGYNGIDLNTANSPDIIINTISGSGNYGVYALNSHFTYVNGNTIDNTYSTGVYLTGSHYVTVNYNDITNVGWDGIYLEHSQNSNIEHNEIDDTGRDGINVYNADDLDIEENDIYNAGRNGITVENDSYSVYVYDNGIYTTGSHGISLDRSNAPYFHMNTIEDAGEDGIHITDSDEALLITNWARRSENNGLYVSNSDDFYSRTMYVVGAGEDGIYVYNGNNTELVTSGIYDVEGRGIAVKQGYDTIITQSFIRNTGGDGIQVTDGYTGYVGSDTQNNYYLNLNKVYRAGEDGIDVDGGYLSTLTQNNVYGAGDNGIEISNSERVKILYNNIGSEEDTSSQIKGHGLDITTSDRFYAEGNHIYKPGKNGINVTNLMHGDIYFYSVTDAGDNGVYFENAYSTDVRNGYIYDPTTNGIQIITTKGDRVAADEDETGSNLGVTYTTSDASRALGNRIYRAGSNGILTSNSDALDLTGNTVENAEYRGIFLAHSEDSRIASNTIQSSGGDGIYTTSAGNLEIAYNEIGGSGTNGIFAGYTTGILDIHDNLVENSNGDGIYVYSADYVRVADNTVNTSGRSGILVHNAEGFSLDTPVETTRALAVDTTDWAVEITGNDVEDTYYAGILVTDSGRTFIADNNISNTGSMNEDPYDYDKEDADGIYADNIYGLLDIRRNVISNAGANGIYADDSANVRIYNNEIYDALDLGIYVDDAYVSERLIPATIALQAIEDETPVITPIPVEDTTEWAVEVVGNTINRTGFTGIAVTESESALIAENTISNIGILSPIEYLGGEMGADGIYVERMYGKAQYMPVKEVLMAVEEGSDTTEDTDWTVKIIDNQIYNTGGDGIQTFNAGDVYIGNNTITGAGILSRPGILNADGINIIGGSRENYYAQGREVYYRPSYPENMVTIEDNIIISPADDGIQAAGVTDLRIERNTITNAGDDGINIIGLAAFGDTETPEPVPEVYLTEARAIAMPYWTSFEALVADNTINNSGDNGIKATGFDYLEVSGNTILDSAANGLYVHGPNNGYVDVSYNMFSNNDIGAQFESGYIDLTQGSNDFYGGRIGLRFAPVDFSEYEVSYGEDYSEEDIFNGLFDDDLFILTYFRSEYDYPYSFPTSGFAPLELDAGSLAGYGGSIGAQNFMDQSEYFVELANGAFYAPDEPTLLNGLESTYSAAGLGTITPITTSGILTSSQYATMEDMFYHYNDQSDLGLFDFGSLPDEDDGIDQQERIFNYFSPFSGPGGNVNVIVAGVPRIPGTAPTAANLAGIAPQAGGDEEDGAPLSPDQLNELEAAGGSETVSCWGDAMNSANGGKVVNYSFGTSLGSSALSAAGSCGSLASAQ